jgi:YegS/Rv2252/BmrU family lipid kinase
VRACVIFNPTARGEKASRFRRHLDQIGGQCALKLTAGPGNARQLAAEAVSEGFEVVVAAGGDGTLNEVLNGVGDAPDGFERTRLGLLALGTMNVVAREFRLPWRLSRAWEVIRRGRETRIDLPCVAHGGKGERRYFTQLGGAGLDARAIELVRWPLKRKIGALAYILAGVEAMCERQPDMVAEADGVSSAAQLVLIGNGRLYGGPFRIFPKADPRDGLLDVAIFPRMGWVPLVRYGLPVLMRFALPASGLRVARTKNLRLTSATPTPLQLDGEPVGQLPATFSIQAGRLRFVVP